MHGGSLRSRDRPGFPQLIAFSPPPTLVHCSGVVPISLAGLGLQSDTHSRDILTCLVGALISCLLPYYFHVYLCFPNRVGTGLQRDAPTRSTLGDGIIASCMAGHPNFHVCFDHLYNLGNIRDLLVGGMFPVPSVTKSQAFRISSDPTDDALKMPVQPRSYNDGWVSSTGKHSISSVCKGSLV